VIPDVVPGLVQALDHLRAEGHPTVGDVSGPRASWMNQHRWVTLFEAAVDRVVPIVEIPAESPTLADGRAARPRMPAACVTTIGRCRRRRHPRPGDRRSSSAARAGAGGQCEQARTGSGVEPGAPWSFRVREGSSPRYFSAPAPKPLMICFCAIR
jgi:hypothetical protein